jgi:MinD superfamily P-loop ATPase containing an inserted ferredoxin domain
MENVIFYFTGTGNSLAVTRDIANKIGDTKIVAITKETMSSPYNLQEYKRIGFVFPVYYSSMPAMVSQFVKCLRFLPAQYIFGTAVFGRARGASLSQLGQYVARCGGRLAAGFGVWMPASYIIAHTALPFAINKIILERAKKKIAAIASVIGEKQNQYIKSESKQPTFLSAYRDKAFANFGNMAANFKANEKCIGCGACERICPACNIKILGKRPKWGTSCEQCVACIQWCPSAAIEYAGKTERRTRYHHPEIHLADMLLR